MAATTYQPEYQTLPVISTGHLKQPTAQLLSRSMPDCQMVDEVIAAPYPHGLFLHLPVDGEPTEFEDLEEIRGWLDSQLHSNGWLRLDSDGPYIAGLTTYEWA